MMKNSKYPIQFLQKISDSRNNLNNIVYFFLKSREERDQELAVVAKYTKGKLQKS